MQLTVERLLLFLQLLSQAFVLCQLLLELTTFLLVLFQSCVLSRDKLDLFDQAGDHVEFRTDSLPIHLFLDSINEFDLLLSKL